MSPVRFVCAMRLVSITWVSSAVALGCSIAFAASAAVAEPAAGRELPVLLRVVPADGAVVPAATLLSAGVPFPEGRLPEPSGLRVVTKDGRPIPAQLERRGSYTQSGDVRWLGVELLSEAGASEFRLEAGQPVAVPDAITVETGSDVLVVRTGRLRAEVGRRKGSLRRVFIDDRPVLEQDTVNWLVRDTDGMRFEGARPGTSEAVVEKPGPLHTVIRVSGRYQEASGSRGLGPHWILRLHFHAGRTEIGVQHTFVWDGPAELKAIREIGVGFQPVSTFARAAAPRAAGQSAEVELPLGSGDRLSLLQDSYRARGAGDEHAAVRHLTGGSARILAESARAGSHVTGISGDAAAGTITLAMRDLWQRFPSELQVAPGHLDALLWTSAGRARALDLTPRGVGAWIGPALGEQVRAKRFRAQSDEMKGAEHLDPTGVARTHRLLLRFGAASEPAAERLAGVHAFDSPPLLIADPKWTAESGVLGLVGAVDDENHPGREQAVRSVYRDVVELIDDWGDYGFLDHGAGPHHAYEVDAAGAAVASPWRYAGLDFGYTRATWVAWLRSGSRVYHDLARPRTHFLSDVLRSHVDAPGRRLGDWYFWASGPTVVPWQSPARPAKDGRHPPLGLHSGFGLDVESMLFDWWLNGDLRSLEVAGEVASALRDLLDEPGAPESWARSAHANRSRWLFQTLSDLAVLGEQLDDAKLRRGAQRIAALALDPTAPGGVQLEPFRPDTPPLPYPTYLFYKAPWILRYLETQSGVERDRARESLLRGAEYALRTRSSESRTAGLRLGLGAQISGDARYLSVARDLVDKRMAVLDREAQGTRGYRHPIQGVLGNVADVLKSQAALVAVLPDDGGSLPVVPVVWKERMRPAASVLLAKPAGQALSAEIVHGPMEPTRPDGSPWPSDWLGETTAYVPEGTNQPVLYRQVRIPASAAGGTYRVLVPWEGALTVLATDAAATRLEAPQGLHLGGGGARPWYFSFAPGAKQIFASSQSALELRDPTGRLIPIPKKRGWMRLTGAHPDGLFSVRGLRPAFFAASALGSLYTYQERSPVGAETHGVVARVPDRKGPTTGFGAGSLSLARKGTFVVDAARLSREQGSIEWWWQPDWDSGALGEGERKGLLAVDGAQDVVQIFYHYSVTPKAAEVWDLRIEALRTVRNSRANRPGEVRGDQARGTREKRRATGRLDRGEHLRLRQGERIHMALDWWKDDEGAKYRLWLNGRPVVGRAQKGASLIWPIPDLPTGIRFGPGTAKRGMPFDGTLHGLRVSSAPRYPGARGPDANAIQGPPEQLDATTSVLCRFESKERPCSDARGRPTGIVLR